MRGETKIIFGYIFSILGAWICTTFMETHQLIGVTLGTIMYVGILIDSKVSHILKQKGWD